MMNWRGWFGLNGHQPAKRIQKVVEDDIETWQSRKRETKNGRLRLDQITLTQHLLRKRLAEIQPNKHEHQGVGNSVSIS